MFFFVFLGAHISLKDKKWNVGVEKCLGNRLMLAFCCHDLHDMNVLNGVFKEHWNGPNPSIIVSRFQVYICLLLYHPKTNVMREMRNY